MLASDVIKIIPGACIQTEQHGWLLPASLGMCNLFVSLEQLIATTHEPLLFIFELWLLSNQPKMHNIQLPVYVHRQPFIVLPL